MTLVVSRPLLKGQNHPPPPPARSPGLVLSTELKINAVWILQMCWCHDPPPMEKQKRWANTAALVDLKDSRPRQSAERPVGAAKPTPRPCPPPTPPRVGRVRGQNKVCVRDIGLKFPAPLINLIFCLWKVLLMWVGRSAGAGHGPKQPPPPSPGLRTEVWGQQRQSNDPRNNQHNPSAPPTGRR